MSTIYEKGIVLGKTERQRLRKSAKGQEEVITELLKISKGLTAFELQDVINSNNLSKSPWPITSIRRALTNMDNDTDSNVQKTSQKREGRFGVGVHVYRFQQPVQKGQGEMFGKPQRKHQGAYSGVN